MLKNNKYLAPIMEKLSKYDFTEDISYCIKIGKDDVWEIKEYIVNYYMNHKGNTEVEELFDEFDVDELSIFFKEAYGIDSIANVSYKIIPYNAKAVKQDNV